MRSIHEELLILLPVPVFGIHFHFRALKKAGKAVMMSVKRESGHLIESVKQNSALKSALRSVSDSGG